MPDPDAEAPAADPAPAAPGVAGPTAAPPTGPGVAGSPGSARAPAAAAAPVQPSEGPRIRRLRWFDIPAVAALDAEIFGPDAWSTEYYWAAIATPGQSFVVIEAPGAARGGTAGAANNGDVPDAEAARRGSAPVPAGTGALLGFAGLGVSGPQADVLTLAAHPAARGRGIGRALLTHLLDTARSAGCEVIHLDVRSDNSAAHGLYTAHGFTELARRPGYYTGADAVVMRAFL